MGDKTQLATISLAADYQNPVSLLIGTTLGMLIADAEGIVVGRGFVQADSPSEN